MTPILFAENATTFTTNGIGRLSDAISCKVEEERNGQYELSMEYPTDGQHYSEIVNRAIIVVKPCVDASLQPFRIYEITKPLLGRITVFARHISYDLGKNTAMPFSVAQSTAACNNTLQGLKSHAVESCPFTFWTDITTIAPYVQPVPATIRERLGGTEGSVLDVFGGEYEWDGYTVKLHRQRGTDSGVVLRYGKNITDINQDEIISETVTGIVPYWTDLDEGTIVTLPEKAVYSQYASRYSTKLTVPMDFSDEFEEAPSVSELRTAAQVIVQKHDVGVPEVSIKVKFVNLADTEEYKDIEALQTVHLCDEVTVQFEPLDISTKAKIAAYEWDVLKDRYRSVTIGTIGRSLAMTLNDNNSRTLQEIDKSKLLAGNAINNATKWLTSAGGYVMAIKNDDGSWRELIFASSTDLEASNTKILRVNNNGIGFSTTGIDGPYRNAWTIDGNLIADFIHGGTLTLGGNNNVNGWLKILNASGTQIGKWDKSGITATGANITGQIHATDSHGSANMQNGVISITSDTNRSMFNMTRGDDYISFNPTTIFWTDGDDSYTKNWKALLEMLDKYQHNHGASLFGTWEGTSTGQPIIKVDTR
jgi:phage minor structural protein